MKLLDHAGREISPAQIASVRMSAAARGTGRYFGAGPGGERRQAALAGWTPSLTSVDGANAWSRDATNARVRDLIRTNGTARAGVHKDVDMVVGHAMKLMSLPDAEALGISVQDAMTLGKAIEAWFRSWAHDPLRRCDRVRRHQFPGLANLLYKEWRSIGESLHVTRMKRRAGWMYSTAIQIINAERLSNPHGVMDSPTLRSGVHVDDAGEAIGYHIRDTHPGEAYIDPSMQTWTYAPKETFWGRPVCVHGFESEEAGQTRGVSPFAAILEAFKMVDRHGHAELSNAVANALYVAFVTSSYDPFSAAESMTSNAPDAAQQWYDLREGHYRENQLVLGDSVIPVLPPGDEIKMNATARQSAGLDVFRSVFLREIASALGVPYITLAEDWKGVTYSSARAALNETWRAVQSRRASFVEQVITPIYYAVIEEGFARGVLTAPDGAPSFWDNPAAYLKGVWIGPGRGYIDRKKEAEGFEIQRSQHASTLRREYAEQGLDYEDELAQVAREQELLGRLEIVQAADPDSAPAVRREVNAELDDPDDADRRELEAAGA